MIDYNKIEQIVREVVAQLTVEEGNQQFDDKPILLVVGDPSFIDSEKAKQLQKSWKVVNYDQQDKLPLNQRTHVLFLHATQDLLAKGALGLCDTPESELLSRCLIESVQVSIIPTVFLQEHLDCQNPKNKVYLSQLQGYKETLRQFGANVETLDRFIEKVCEIPVSNKGEALKIHKKKLITRRDVKAYTGNYLVVDSHTIMTPLARDTAREMGINIKELYSEGAKR